MTTFDRQRADAARAFSELAAEADDPQDALVHQMAADDLTREMSPAESEAISGLLGEDVG